MTNRSPNDADGRNFLVVHYAPISEITIPITSVAEEPFEDPPCTRGAGVLLNLITFNAALRREGDVENRADRFTGR